MLTDHDLMRELAHPTPSKIVMLIIDGLGGLPDPRTGKTELETAKTPNLDALAARGMCGLSDPVYPGITPGSAPGHLGLFGYDPLQFVMGRGALEAVGVNFELQCGDVAARGNFCTVDDKGLVSDRRAGRIPTEKCAELARLIDGQTIEDVKVFAQPVSEHRFAVVFRGPGLSPELTDSDPEATGVPPNVVKATNEQSQKAARIVNQFVANARKTLASQKPANMVLLRGFAGCPDLPAMKSIFKLNPAAIAPYPMYRGLAQLVGMKILPHDQHTVQEEFEALKQNYANHDFFFIHVKGADSAGEDGDFARKVKVIEEVDKALPTLSALKPDVIIFSADHSTPARLKGHSWHPVPILLVSDYCRRGHTGKFGETTCQTGALGHIQAKHILPLAMAHALKLNKFGA